MSSCDDIDVVNGKIHIFIRWFYNAVIDHDSFALSSRAGLWNWLLKMIGGQAPSDLLFVSCLSLDHSSVLPCFIPVFGPPSSTKRFLRCSPFDEFSLWKSQVDNGSKKGGERLNILTKSLLLRRTKDQLDSTGKPLVIPLTCVPGGGWEGGWPAVHFASGASEGPFSLGGGPQVAGLPLVSQPSCFQGRAGPLGNLLHNSQQIRVTSAQLLFSFILPGGAAPASISVAPFKAFRRWRDSLQCSFCKIKVCAVK